MAEEDKKPEETEVEETAATAPTETAEVVVEEPTAEESSPEPVADKPKRAPRRKASTEQPAQPAAKEKVVAAKDEETAPVVRAQAKYVRTSARKARLVCDHIRGKSVDEARAILAFTPRAAAKDWAKLLNSAVANAENNHELLGSDLKVATVYADEGPTLKRFQPRAMGRATRIRKRTSHLTITLTPKG
ncbi:MAG: ribosomal protein [Solirubrobacterales bacterium]|jgi:ribosomal protein L22|nr:ribosomal protein [Solirubrobacterales bacterium]